MEREPCSWVSLDQKSYLHHLAKCCDYRNLTPRGVVEEFRSSKKKGQDALEDYVRMLSTQKSSESAKMALAALKSWLGRFEDANGSALKVDRKIKLNGIGSTPTLADEKVPTRAELERTMDRADVGRGP